MEYVVYYRQTGTPHLQPPPANRRPNTPGALNPKDINPQQHRKYSPHLY